MNNDNRLNNTRLNTLIHNTLYDESRYRRVVSDDVIEKLKILKYSKNTCKNDKCPILYVDFSEEDDVILLECGHCFEPESIKKWLKEHKAECPVCRYKLESVEIRVNDSTPSNHMNTNNNFRRLYDINITELITSLHRSHNILGNYSVHSNIHQYSDQPQSSLATVESSSVDEYLYFPNIQRIIQYDDDFYDFVEFYQYLFDIEN
jgi:hypothetical protein